MIRSIGVILAIGFGLGSGWVVRHLPVRSIAQDLGATRIGWLLGCLIVAAVALAGLVFLPKGGGLGAVSFGLSETVILGLPMAGLLAVVGRTALHWLGAVVE